MQHGGPSCIFNSRSLNNVANTHCRYVYDYINNRNTVQLIRSHVAQCQLFINSHTDQGIKIPDKKSRREMIVKKETALSINRQSSSSASSLSTIGSHEEALSVNRITSRACTSCTRERTLWLALAKDPFV